MSERARVAIAWLPVVDNLERALQHADPACEALAAGVLSVHQEAQAVLTRLGFPRYEDIGRPFDPARHEAVGVMESDAAPGTIVAIARPGYGTEEVVLRPAAVVVAKGAG
jgi:molecular chaperone GrpE